MTRGIVRNGGFSIGRKHHTEEQSAFAPRQAESSTPAAEIIRRLGVSEQTSCRRKKQFAGPGVAELRRRETSGGQNRHVKHTDLYH